MRGDDGHLYVEHTWSHTALKGLTTNSGEEKIAVPDFMAHDHPWAARARDALSAYLQEHGGAA